MRKFISSFGGFSVKGFTNRDLFAYAYATAANPGRAFPSTRYAGRGTRIWKLEAAQKCRSCRTPRYSPPVHMIKLTREREIAPYVWVHPDDDR